MTRRWRIRLANLVSGHVNHYDHEFPLGAVPELLTAEWLDATEAKCREGLNDRVPDPHRLACAGSRPCTEGRLTPDPYEAWMLDAWDRNSIATEGEEVPAWLRYDDEGEDEDTTRA